MKDIRSAEISPRDRAVCANALDKILNRKRVLRMKPAPKSVDADKYKEQQKMRKQGYEPLFVDPSDEPIVPTEIPGS